MAHLTRRWLPKAQPSLIRALLRVLTIERPLSGNKDLRQGGSFIVPNDVRINGVSVLTVGGVKVHEMDVILTTEMATVALTLPVRLFTIAAEGDLRY